MTSSNTWCLTCLSTLIDGASIPEPMGVFLREVLHFKCKQLEEKSAALVCRKCYCTLIEFKRFYAQLRDVELYLKCKSQDLQNSEENDFIDEVQYVEGVSGIEEVHVVEEVHDVEEVYTTEFESADDYIDEVNQDPILIEVEVNSQAVQNSEESRIPPNTQVYASKGEQRFVCLICSKLFNSFRELRLHENEHTTATTSNPSSIPQKRQKRLPCPDCGARFDLMKGLMNHSKIHEVERRKPFRCLNCNRRFVTSEALRDHELIHIDVQTSQCEICHKKYLNRSSLEAHMRVSHNCSSDGIN